MKCSQCGRTCERNSSFCSICGSPLSAPKRSFPVKKVLLRILICGLAAAAIAVGVSAARTFLNRQDMPSDGFLLVPGRGETTAIFHNDHLIQRLTLPEDYDAQFNFGQTAGLITSRSTLRVVTREEITELKNVRPNTHVLSADGDFMAYITDDDRLILRDIAGKTEQEIIRAEEIRRPVISPDGQSLAFCVLENDQAHLMVYTKGALGSEVLLGCSPIGISNDAGLLYCRKDDTGELLVSRNGEDPTVLAVKPSGTYAFNRDLTEILFGVSEDGEWYVSEEGTAPCRIASDTEDLTLLQSAFEGSAGEEVKTYDIPSFAGRYYHSADRDAVYLVEKQWTTREFGADAASAVLGGDRTVYCHGDGSLHMIKGTKETTIMENEGTPLGLRGIAASSDGKHFYCVAGEDQTLYHIKNGGKPEAVAAQVGKIYMTRDDKLLLRALDEDGNPALFCLRNNGRLKKLCNDVQEVCVGAGSAAYTAEGDMFCATGTLRFKQVDFSDR